MNTRYTKLREVEKLHMHTSQPPKIDRSNAHIYCIKQETFALNSSLFAEEFTAYYFKGGFVFIPDPMAKKTKQEIVKTVLTQLLYPPYKNSIDRVIDIENTEIYRSYLDKKDMELKIKEDPRTSIRIRQDPYAPQEQKDAFQAGIIRIKPEDLIKKIRWSSMGIYYDWEKKAYDKSIVSEIPAVIERASQEISESICKVKFSPETAVINYYQKKDRIMAHIDRYEEDMTKPLISYSFGNSCVFVLGGKEREDPDIDTFLLEDGDIAILFNESREYFHGVPKILPINKGVADYRESEYFSLISDSRINISIRQAYKYKDA